MVCTPPSLAINMKITFRLTIGACLRFIWVGYILSISLCSFCSSKRSFIVSFINSFVHLFKQFIFNSNYSKIEFCSAQPQLVLPVLVMFCYGHSNSVKSVWVLGLVDGKVIFMSTLAGVDVDVLFLLFQNSTEQLVTFQVGYNLLDM